ncbi:MAG: Crp/Fnr family transcriptional regulator [Bacteroidales bacterium]|nr:Crp/Fnr family transcriptional regulator [Bacteroidales bacterium]
MDCVNCKFRSRTASYLNNEELGYMSSNCAVVKHKAGEIIIKEGMHSTHVAYIKSGLAKVHKEAGPEGIETILKLSGAGSYIGIQTVLADPVHQFSVTCLDDSELCYIDIHSFRELLRRNPAFSYETILYLCQDELQHFNRLISLSNRQVNGRIAHALLCFSSLRGEQENQFTLPLSRTEIGSLVNASRESVSRVLQNFHQSGIIELNGKKLVILNRAMLNTLALKG